MFHISNNVLPLQNIAMGSLQSSSPPTNYEKNIQKKIKAIVLNLIIAYFKSQNNRFAQMKQLPYTTISPLAIANYQE